MRNGFRTGAALLLTAAMAACGGGDDEIETFDTDMPAAEEPAGAERADVAVMTAQFQAPEGSDQTVSGTAMIYRVDGADMSGTTATPETPPTDQTADQATTDEADMEEPRETEMEAGTAGQGWRVEVSVNGLSDGEHAWHVHSGPCGEEAPVVVAFSETSDMEGVAGPLNVRNGTASSQATVPGTELGLEQLQSGEHSIHVHERGGVDHGPTVACADLTGQGGMSM